MDNIIEHLDKIGIIFSTIAAVISVMLGLYNFVIKPAIKLYKSHFVLVSVVDTIKKEVTPNGGSSIKDIINRIDRRQVMIDKRSKAIFYNVDDAI